MVSSLHGHQSISHALSSRHSRTALGLPRFKFVIVILILWRETNQFAFFAALQLVRWREEFWSAPDEVAFLHPAKHRTVQSFIRNMI